MGAGTVLINTYKLQRKGTATAAGSRQPGWFVTVAGDDPNKQTRNQTSRGVSQQVRDYFTGRQNKKTTENQR